MTSGSPYARAIGDRMPHLHPDLQRYFSAIEDGHVGVGEGVFDRVGTRKRWMRPLLRPLQIRGVLVSGWHRDVRFRIENRLVAGRVIAERTLALPDGSWIMRDAVALKPHGRLVDELGEPATIAASFDTHVSNGALVLESRAVGIRLGWMHVRVPAFVAPTVRLIERFDAASGRQRVDVTITMPLIGRIYEYGGSFDYRIERENA